MGGIHISHMRDEAEGRARQRARDDRDRRAGRPADADHAPQDDRQGDTGAERRDAALIDEARARGVDATIDQYPYTASSTSIGAALLPAWAQEGGREATLKRLKDPATRAKIKAESVAIIRDERGGGDPKNVVGLGVRVGSDARRQEPRADHAGPRPAR